jgi:hypothetical protein
VVNNMVRRNPKYRWRYRRYHFQELSLRKAFTKKIYEESIIPSIFELYGSSDAGEQRPPPLQTRCGSEPGTTIPGISTILERK